MKIPNWLKKFWDTISLKEGEVIESPTIVSAPTPQPAKPVVAPSKKRKIKKCDIMGKMMFTRPEAEQAREEILRKKKQAYLRIYCCEFCNWWHLTHKRS